jgi:hypothetical protein
VLDVCRVRIGDFTLFGPGVQILTPMHPLNAALRRRQEYGKPVQIGADVWVGGGALILAGVSIGSRPRHRRWQREAHHAVDVSRGLERSPRRRAACAPAMRPKTAPRSTEVAAG